MANTDNVLSPVAQCPDCGGPVVTDTESVCGDCHAVLEDSPIDRGPDWRDFDDNEQTPRAEPGDNPQLHDGGLGSTISWDRTLSQMHARQRDQHERAKFRSKAEQIRAHGLRDIQTLCSRLELPESVTSRACRIWKDYHRTVGILGETREGYTTASVLVACREQSLPVTVQDVCENSNAPRSREVFQAVQKLASELGLDALAPKPLRFVPRLCSELGLPAHVRPEAERQCRLAQAENAHVGRKPFAVAGTAVWLASGATQVDIAEAAQCTTTTIRKIRDEWPNGQITLDSF